MVGIAIGTPLFRTLIVGALGGALLSAVSFLLSRFVSDRCGRAVLALLLFASAAAYPAFSISAHPIPWPWITVELLQLIPFAAIALLGFRSSPRWLILGWALHPACDLLIEWYGPQAVSAPLWYPMVCVSFDLVVALYIAIAYEILALGLRRFRGT